MPGRLPPLIALTDPVRTPDVLAFAQGLPGSCALIFRHFGGEAREAEARQLAALAREKNFVLLIAADPDLADTVGADGVHWPARLHEQARDWRTDNPHRTMTMSAHNREELELAASAEADAALLSPIYSTQSAGSGPAIGTEEARRLVLEAKLPVYALGGITAVTASEIQDIGIAGMAAIGGLKA